MNKRFKRSKQWNKVSFSIFPIDFLEKTKLPGGWKSGWEERAEGRMWEGALSAVSSWLPHTKLFTIYIWQGGNTPSSYIIISSYILTISDIRQRIPPWRVVWKLMRLWRWSLMTLKRRRVTGTLCSTSRMRRWSAWRRWGAETATTASSLLSSRPVAQMTAGNIIFQFQ